MLECAEGIRAKNIHIARLDKIVSYLFELDGAFTLTLLAQESDTLTENRNAGVVRLRRDGSGLEKTNHAFEKFSRIRQTVY